MEQQEEQPASATASRQQEDLANRGSRVVRAPIGVANLVMERDAEESLARKQWYETGRWAEYYVSGECVRRAIAFAEAHVANSDIEEQYLQTLVSKAEELCLQDMRSALRTKHNLDLAAMRSRLISNDPKETIHAAQAVLGKAKTIAEEHDNDLQSFRSIPEHYYADPITHARILDVQQALAKQRVAATKEVQRLMDLYDEILGELEDQIIGMREEGDVLEEFVTQPYNWKR